MNFGVILAGGMGTRMGIENLPKQYVEVNGKPILVYTLEKFQLCPDIHKIIVVADESWYDRILAWCRQYGIEKFSGFAAPGETRQKSVFNGLLACDAQRATPDDIVAIHDAARPMVSPELISAGIVAAGECDGALAAITAKDTIYGCQDGRFITGLYDRAALCCGQTPETYKLTPCLEINRKATPEDLAKFHGCSELMFKYGLNVRVIPGEEMNFKLTTQEDLDRLYTVLGIPRKPHH